MPFPILVISSVLDHKAKLAEGIIKSGLQMFSSDNIADAKTLMDRQPFSVVVSEDRLSDGDFQTLLGRMGHYRSKVPVVVVSRRDDWDGYLAAISAGAFAYVAFPPRPGELEQAVFDGLDEAKRSQIDLVQPVASC